MPSYKILIIEDDPLHYKILSQVLREMDYHVELLKAESGIKALEILKTEIPDLILTDWDMPQMSGIDFCKIVQANKKLEQIPVIMCTGINKSSTNLKTAFDSGVVDFIRKPIDKMELVSRVNSMLRLSDSYKTIKRQKEELETEKQKSDRLLLNILPQKIAKELKEKGESKPQLYKNITVLYSDIVDFTRKTLQMPPSVLLNELNDLTKGFDLIMEKHSCEKIKTVGDAYVGVCGLPEPNPNHAQNILNAAKDIIDFLNQRNSNTDFTWEVRIGIDTGDVMGGIIGATKYVFDIFGDPVNTASRLESNSETMRIHLSERTYKLVKDEYEFEEQAPLEVKGKGLMKMFFVV